jgi:ribosomal protein L14
LLKKSTVPSPPLDVDGGVGVGPAGANRATRVARRRDVDDDGGIDGSESLEQRIQRRDERLSYLQDELRTSQSHLAKCARDDHALRRGLLESTHRHAVAVRLWRRTNDGLRARVECFEAETTPDAAREIANLIRDAAPPNKDSAYLMMLQDQLIKAMTKLEHLGSQTEIVLHKGEEVVESLREEMNEVIRERCRMELELLDQERMLEDDMRRMVVRTERRLRRVQGEIDYLEKNAVEVLKKQDEEEEEEEEENDEDDDEE